jgi:hypothetical protein
MIGSKKKYRSRSTSASSQDSFSSGSYSGNETYQKTPLPRVLFWLKKVWRKLRRLPTYWNIFYTFSKQASFGRTFLVPECVLIVQGPMLWYWNILAQKLGKKWASFAQNIASLTIYWRTTLVFKKNVSFRLISETETMSLFFETCSNEIGRNLRIKIYIIWSNLSYYLKWFQML